MRARVAATIAVAAAVLASTVPAHAASSDDEDLGAVPGGSAGARVVDNRTAEIEVNRPGTPAPAGPRSGPAIDAAHGYDCTWYPIGPDGRPVESAPYDPPPPDGTYAWLRCSGPESIDGPRTRQSGATVAASAVERLPLPGPEVATNPDAGHDQLVGVPTWLWVRNWRPMAVTAAVPGTTAELVATPLSVTYDMGDGETPLTCDGPGTPYDTSRPAAAQRSDCTYTYARSSAGRPGATYTVTATFSWGLRWSSTTGQGGTLPTLRRSSTFELRVAEAQALVVGRR